MPDLKPGYILHADHEWVQYHRTNSIGGGVAYCRGPGAPMRNVSQGGKVFFRDREATPKAISLWADFDRAEKLSLSDAWNRFGTQLGASTPEEWSRIVARLP